VLSRKRTKAADIVGDAIMNCGCCFPEIVIAAPILIPAAIIALVIAWLINLATDGAVTQRQPRRRKDRRPRGGRGNWWDKP